MNFREDVRTNDRPIYRHYLGFYNPSLQSTSRLTYDTTIRLQLHTRPIDFTNIHTRHKLYSLKSRNDPSI